MKDIVDEIRKHILPCVELDEGHLELTAILSDDNRRAKAIRELNARMRPYRNRDFPPNITSTWLTNLYLRAQGRSCERRKMIENIKLDFKLGRLRRAHCDN